METPGSLTKTNKNVPPILIAEDDEDDFLIIFNAFGENQFLGEINWYENGQDLLNVLYRLEKLENRKTNPFPSLILLDINIPQRNGMEVLEIIKSKPPLCLIPVIIISGSSDKDQVLKAYELGANSFISKNSNPISFTRQIRAMGQYWFDAVLLPPNEPYIE